MSSAKTGGSPPDSEHREVMADFTVFTEIGCHLEFRQRVRWESRMCDTVYDFAVFYGIGVRGQAEKRMR
jgi:hypothetical protein